MFKPSSCDYSDTQLLVKGTIIITDDGVDDAAKRRDVRNNAVIFKNGAPFRKCIAEINNACIINVKYVDVVIATYNLVEYTDNNP